MDFNISKNESGKMGLVSLRCKTLLNLYLSIIENNCTEEFAKEVDGELVIEKNTFDGFNVSVQDSLL